MPSINILQFEVTDFKANDISWDNIIPESELEAIKEEELRKNEESYLK